MPRLTVHNAQISTATVEIKTLTISGKQVTLAVFRQLQEQQLVTYDGELNGVPWGSVNYCPDKDCKDASEHIHVVWQHEQELRRFRACRPYANEEFEPDSGDEFAQVLFCANDHSNGKELNVLRGPDRGFVSFYVKGVRCIAARPGSIWSQADGGQKCSGGCATPDKVREIEKDFYAEVEVEAQRRARQGATYESLCSLPQLFIAV